MAFNLKLPKSLKEQGWKAKIRDRERVEPPHVSILNGTETWRWDLRRKSFMDKEPPPKLVPVAVMKHIEEKIDQLIEEWDKMYPNNKVSSGSGE